MKKKVVVIVDGYRIGNTLAQKIMKKGYDCVHIQSSIHISKKLRIFDPKGYQKLLIYKNNLNEILKILKRYQILSIIPGCESGVDLSEILVEKLNISSQITKHIGVHTDKYKMIEILKKNNVSSIDTILASTKEQIYKWVKNKKWPIVLKPPKSSSTFLVKFCYSKKDIEKAFNKIINTRTVTAQKSKQVVAQTAVRGTEYIVNSVSYNHKHFFSDFWVYNKIYIEDHTSIYDYTKLLPFNFPEKNKLTSYALKTLDALDIKQGPAHSEIFITKKGPIQMEMGARVMGAIPPDPIDLAIGRNQLDLAIDSYLAPKKFLREIKKRYKLKNYLLVKFFISPHEGELKSIRYLEKIKSLPSFYSMNLKVKKGKTIKKTIDLPTSPGIIILLHKKEHVMMKDYKTIFRLEKTMFQI